MRGTADMLVGLSRMAWYRNDLVASAEHLRRSDELGEAASLPQNPYRWRVGMARLRAAEGDLVAALELLDEAERVYVGDYSPNVQPVHASRARVLAASGDLVGARAWARDHGVTIDDDLSYFHEYEHITLARVLLAEQGGAAPPGSTGATGSTGSSASLGAALTLLGRLLAAATYGGRAGSVIELEVLRATAHDANGDRGAALEALRHAIDLAESHGWVRVFVDAAPAVTPLLRELATTQPLCGHLRELLHSVTANSAANGVARGADSEPAGAPDSAPSLEPGPRLVDPLSDRELDVLRLLRSDLDGPAIARQLVVSLNTVRSHTKAIYAKLGVTSRRAAVHRAAELDLSRRSRSSLD